MISTVDLFGYTIASLSVDEVVERMMQLRKLKQFQRVVTLNSEMVIHAQQHKLLKQWLRKASLVVADGQGIALASRLLKQTSLGVSPGVDIVLTLLQKRGISVYCVGASPDVCKRLMSIFQDQYTHVHLKGIQHGFFDRFSQVAIIEDIVRKQPDFIFIGMGIPRQEYFIQSLSHSCSRGVAIGVGGALDVLSGVVTLAPSWVRRLKCEWLYRAYQSPRRILRWPLLLKYLIFMIRQMF